MAARTRSGALHLSLGRVRTPRSLLFGARRSQRVGLRLGGKVTLAPVQP
jgi:hypothetical protein